MSCLKSDANQIVSGIAQDLMRLIDYANAPIFGIDHYGKVNEWNRKAAEITGFGKEEVIGRSLVQDFITAEFQASVKEVLDNALRGKGTDNFEFPLYSRNGKKVEVLLNATTRVDSNSVPIGVIGVGQDITERKTVEQEVTRLAMDLQRLIDSANGMSDAYALLLHCLTTTCPLITQVRLPTSLTGCKCPACLSCRHCSTHPWR